MRQEALYQGNKAAYNNAQPLLPLVRKVPVFHFRSFIILACQLNTPQSATAAGRGPLVATISNADNKQLPTRHFICKINTIKYADRNKS